MKQALYKQNEKMTLYCETNQISSSNHVFSRKNKNLWVLIFRISRVRRVGWWNLITSVRLLKYRLATIEMTISGTF